LTRVGGSGDRDPGDLAIDGLDVTVDDVLHKMFRILPSSVL
jgi:hypothetical protein